MNDEQQKVWDRLKHGIPPGRPRDFGFNAAATPPPQPFLGEVYYDTTRKTMRIYDGSQWKNLV